MIQAGLPFNKFKNLQLSLTKISELVKRNFINNKKSEELMNFSELNLKNEYHSLRDDIVRDFYNPVLNQAIMYKRAVGFFSSYALRVLAAGILKLLDNDGKIQLITAPHLSTEDVEAISYGLSCRNIADRTKLIEQTKNFQGNFNKVGLNLLSNLIALEVLEIKIAFIENSGAFGTFNEKMGLMYDREGNMIAFSGSVNESANSLKDNYNSIDVFSSWTNDSERVHCKEKLFNSLWNNEVSGVQVLDFDSQKITTFDYSKVSHSKTPEEFFDDFNDRIEKTKNPKRLDIILQSSFDKIRRALDAPQGITGVSSGFIDFDKLTSGLQKSDLILLAARPSMGKTALAFNMAMNAALENNVVVIFSLEINEDQIVYRLLSSYSGINSYKLSMGNLDKNELSDLYDTLSYLSDRKLFIDDTARISVLELRSKVRKIKNEHGLDLIVIDYIQLIQPSKEYRGNRTQEIAEISRELKMLAKELEVPIIAVSQLSRNVEQRDDKRPILADLRDSGTLEQDADIVMFLYREDYYDKETENSSKAELIIEKNRNGPTTAINLHFNKECMRFGNLGVAEE